MNITDAAQYFNQDPVYDGYSGAFLWLAQTSSFNASSSDGETFHRRVLETAPANLPPARGVVTLYSERWLVGNTTPDGFQGVPIRRHYTMKLATHLMAVLTPGQAISAAAGTPAYSQAVFFKDMVNTQTDSQYDSFWNFFFAPGEAATKGAFLRDENGVLYKVRNDYLPAEGLRVAQSDQLDGGCLVTAVFDTGAVDPVTEVKSAGTTQVSAIFMEVPKFYVFTHISDPGTQPGDRAVFVPGSLAVKNGQIFTVNFVKWRALSVVAEGDAQVIHARLA